MNLKLKKNWKNIKIKMFYITYLNNKKHKSFSLKIEEKRRISKNLREFERRIKNSLEVNGIMKKIFRFGVENWRSFEMRVEYSMHKKKFYLILFNSFL